MVETVDQAALRHLHAYLSGSISLVHFKDWFLDHALTAIFDEPYAEKTHVAIHEIDFFLVEYAGGTLDEHELRDELRRIWNIQAGPNVILSENLKRAL